MSSTSNSQNLLVNVFRPTYVYDATKGYVPKLVVSNVDSVVGTSATFSTLNVGDASSNVYLGRNAGNPATLVGQCNSSNITAIGLQAGQSNQSSSNSVFLGNSAGSNTSNVSRSIYLGESNGVANSNCENSVYIGFNAANGISNASNEIAIGTNAIAGGQSNIYIGPSTGSKGNRNIFIGGDISGNFSDQLRIGRGSNIAIFGDLSRNRVSINTTNSVADFQVKGDTYFMNKVGIQTSAPRSSLDVTGQVYATDGILIGARDVSQPGIALADAPTTGIYGKIESGNPSIGFALGGVSRLVMVDTSFIVNANLQVNGTFGVATNFGSNIIAQGTIRMPNLDGSDIDISGGNIKAFNTITTGGGTINMGNGYITDTCTNGYIRMLNDSSVPQIDLSGGNISNSGLIRTKDVSATGYIRVGGTDISGGNITNASLIRTQDVSATGYIRVGGTDISGGNITNASLIRTQDVSATGYIRVGGTDISGGNITNASLIRTQDISATGYIRVGGTDISGGRISNSLTIVTRDISTTQSAGVQSFISGVRFSNGTISNAGASTNTIGGISLSSSNISNSGTSSNTIGGVTIGLGGTLTTIDSSLSRIGGVTFLNGVISNDSTTTSTIGGVTLSNNAITASGSNLLGGVTLDSTNITFAGTITGTNNSVTHRIGNVKFSNGVTTGFALGDISSANSSQALFVEGSLGGGMYLLKGNNNNKGGLGFYTNVDSSTTVLERMRIHPENGFVGIGTQNIPLGKVDIYDISFAPLLRLTDGNRQPTLELNRNGGAAYGTQGILDWRILATNQSGNFQLRRSQDSSETIPFHINGTVDGNIGIGTTNPQRIIDVSFTGSTNGMRVRGSNSIIEAFDPRNTSGFQFFQNEVYAGICSQPDRAIRFQTNGNTDRMCISGTNVGIGTITPTFNLDICGNQRLSGTITFANTFTPRNKIELYTTSGGTAGLGMLSGEFRNSADAATTAITWGSYTGASWTERMRLDNVNGRLGIGTPTPQRTLDVSGNFRITRGDASAGLFDVVMEGATGEYATTSTNGSFTVYRAGTTNKATSNIFAQIRSDSAPHYFLSNNVGIGTSNPQYTLDVNGTIRGSSNIVSVATATYNMSSSFNTISATSYTDLMNLSFTPKQTGNVSLIVEVRYEVKMISGGGDDGGNFRLVDGVPNELAFNSLYTPPGFNLLSTTSIIHPLRYVGIFNGTQTFKLQYQCFSGGIFEIRRGVLTVYEISQI